MGNRLPARSRLGQQLLLLLSLSFAQSWAHGGDTLADHIAAADLQLEKALKLVADSRAAPADNPKQTTERANSMAQIQATLDRDAFLRLKGKVEHLSYKSFDIAIEAAADRLTLGDNAGAMQLLNGSALRQLSLPNVGAVLSKPPFSKLASEPGYQALIARMNAPSLTGSASPIGSRYKETLSDAEKVAGLSLFWAEVRRSFVHLGNLTETNWDAVYLDAIPKVLAAKTTYDYYAVLLTLPPVLRDAHVNIIPPNELMADFGSRPPIRTALVEGKVIVTSISAPQLKEPVAVGDEIVEIDGLRVDDYVRQFVEPQVSYSSPQDKDVRLYNYQLLSGRRSQDVKLKLRGATGDTRSVTLARSGGNAPNSPPLADLAGGVLYMRLNSFNNKASTAVFHESMDRVMASKALILDLRDNGGGSGAIGYDVLACLTKSTIPTSRSLERREGAMARLRENAFVLQAPEGALYSGHANTCKRIYEGKVALLVGPKTFSAAEDFIVSFRTLKRGKLIGMRTAGGTGAPLQFKLPGGGSARVTAKHDSFPDGTEFIGLGIAPDIEVMPTLKDYRSGKDATLEAAQAYLLGEL